MQLEQLPYQHTVCKVASLEGFDTNGGFYFIGRTDDEISLVCETSAVPAQTTAREDGWQAMRIVGQLDFSLVGVLAKITDVLAKAEVGIFAVSTYNTDYILVKADRFERATKALAAAGYEIR